MPIAVNGGAPPKGTATVCGLIAIDTNVAAVTINTVEPVTVPELALTVDVPMPALVARPFRSMLAVEVVSDDQVVVEVRS